MDRDPEEVILYVVSQPDVERAVIEKNEKNEKKYPVDLAKDNAVKYNKR
jgi:hypothetical protein